MAVVRKSVIGFYAHKPCAPFKEFSNFFTCTPPFEFRLPDFARRSGFSDRICRELSEKAIMYTKAALMGDRATAVKIVQASAPASCKDMGRQVTGFDDELWHTHVNDIAFEVVKQMFQANVRLAELLLSTGDAILAEATRKDRLWGIGLDVGDARVQQPEKWLGRNVLGEALMRARSLLRGNEPISRAAATSASATISSSSPTTGGTLHCPRCTLDNETGVVVCASSCVFYATAFAMASGSKRGKQRKAEQAAEDDDAAGYSAVKCRELQLLRLIASAKSTARASADGAVALR